MGVLLRCRMGGPPDHLGETEVDPVVAEWAQQVVAASRPGSAAAGGAPPPPLWLGRQPDAAAPVASTAQAALPAGVPPPDAPAPAAAASEWEQLEAASFASLPPGPEAEEQRRQGLDKAVAAWREAASPPAEPQPCVVPQQDLQQEQASGQQALQQALLAWQAASLAAAAEQQQQQHAGGAAEGKAQHFSQTLIEDAVTGWSRPASAGQPTSVTVRVAVPPPLPPPQPVWQAAPLPPQTDTFSSPTQQRPAYPAVEPLPWAPWLLQQASPAPGSMQSKYPHVWFTPDASAVPMPCWPEPESPRILAYPEPSSVVPAAAASQALPEAAGALPRAAAALAGASAAEQPAEGARQQMLLDCLVAWRGTASAAAAAQRAAELRGTARAEDFHEAQLLRQCFGAWRCHRLAVMQAVLGRIGSAAQRHAFLQVGRWAGGIGSIRKAVTAGVHAWQQANVPSCIT